MSIKKDNIYDYVIIGAGFAGLYWIKQYNPVNWICIEKTERIGGRVYNIDWNNNHISLGGGIFRPEHEFIIKLTKEYNLEIVDSISKYHLVGLENNLQNVNKPNEDNFYTLNKIITKYLKKLYKKNKKEIIDKKLNFEEFLNYYLDSKISSFIISNLLYKTYLEADVEYTLYYEFDELLRTKNFDIRFIKNKGYTSLLDNLLKSIDTTNIKLNQSVNKIEKIDNFYSIQTTDNKIFRTKNLILATESESNISFNFDSKLNNLIKELYEMVNGSNYIRIYSYHSESHGLKCSYRTSNLPGKVILINDNVLMCCYTENEQAIKLYNLLNKNNLTEQIDIIYNILINSEIPISSKPDDIIMKFWNTGVHYNTIKYNENRKNEILNQLYDNNIYVIGESINKTHGWVNCALESVEFYKNKFKN